MFQCVARVSYTDDPNETHGQIWEPQASTGMRFFFL